MKRISILIWLVMLGSPAFAEKSKQFCHPMGFCIEADQPFLVSKRQGVDFDLFGLVFGKGGHRISVYLGGHPSFPNCENDCERQGEEPDQKAFIKYDGSLAERLIGPLQSCKDRRYFIHLIATPLSEARLSEIRVQRRCD